MKKTLCLLILALCILTLWADLRDFWQAQYLDILSTKLFQAEDTWQLEINEVSDQLCISDNYYDYSFSSNHSNNFLKSNIFTFPNSIQFGHWLTFLAQEEENSLLKNYYTYINEFGQFQNTYLPFNYDNLSFLSATTALTEAGRPLFANNSTSPNNPNWDLNFAYDSIIGGFVINITESFMDILDESINLTVNNINIEISELTNPILQTGPSPQENFQRVYICAQANSSDLSLPIPVILYADFSEDSIEYLMFENDWQFVTIPEINNWALDNNIVREPYMAFRVHEDKLFYVGYHFAKDITNDNSIIYEPSIDVFVCDNYGQGLWERHSIHDTFTAYNPNYINPTAYHQGSQEDREFFDTSLNDFNDNDFFIGIGESTNFTVGIDAQNRVHIPALYTLKTFSGNYYPELHTIKDIIFNPYNNNFFVVDVYPKTNDNIHQITDNNGLSTDTPWLWWDADGDGIIDEIRDDGTWDGIDDNVSPDNTEYWGRPVLQVLWPFQYWDDYAGDDNNALKHLNHIGITDDSYFSKMAMYWHDTSKSRFNNKHAYPNQNLTPYKDVIETMISISNNGFNWSQPLALNKIDYPQIAQGNPTFALLDIARTNPYNTERDLFLAYNDDTSYGSSVLGIGNVSLGHISYLAMSVKISNGYPSDFYSEDSPNISEITLYNYPNPFNPETTISYELKQAGNVEIEIYNIRGQKVKNLLNEYKDFGKHSSIWDGTDNNNNAVASGIYLYKIKSGKYSSSKKMILLK